MSAFSGPAHKGAMRERREQKRLEAAERNARNAQTLPENRSKKRRERAS